jgi:hypothetical protein
VPLNPCCFPKAAAAAAAAMPVPPHLLPMHHGSGLWKPHHRPVNVRCVVDKMALGQFSLCTITLKNTSVRPFLTFCSNLDLSFRVRYFPCTFYVHNVWDPMFILS